MKRTRTKVPFGCARLAQSPYDEATTNAPTIPRGTYCLVQGQAQWAMVRLLDNLYIADCRSSAIFCDASVRGTGTLTVDLSPVVPVSWQSPAHKSVWQVTIDTSVQTTTPPCYLATLDPVPLTSLTVSYKKPSCGTVLHEHPLLQTCLKRQLVGACVLSKETTIQQLSLNDITSWTFTVVQTSSPNQFGVILPSTSITVVADTDVDSTTELLRSLRIQDETVSDAARFLMDTIYCVQRGVVVGGDIPRAILLSGPPGCGKTFAVQTAVRRTRVHCCAIPGSKLAAVAHHPCEAAQQLEQLFVRAIQKTLPSRALDTVVVFLDECDSLFAAGDTSEASQPFLAAMLGSLLDRMNADMQWKHLVVVGATNRVDSLPSALRRPGRFDREIIVRPPDAVARLEILRNLIGEHCDSESLKEIADTSVGYVPADLAALVRRAKHLYLVQLQDDTRNRPLTEFLHQAMADVGASALRDAATKAPPKMTWRDVAGDPGGAKTALRQAIEWPRTRSRAFRMLGLSPPRGILLHGPPGCAKTTLARAAAGSLGIAFLAFSPADVYSSSFVGEAETVVRRAFTLARDASPCILFFDEIDAILGCHEASVAGHGMGRETNAAEARVLSTFLNEMDGIDGSSADGVLVLGATNRPQTLDAALMRPGRFDKVIYVPPPDLEGRRSILEMQCKHWESVGSESCSVDIDKFAKMSENMTGAEIVGACREAVMIAFRQENAKDKFTMKEEYLLTSLGNVRPLLNNASVLLEYQSFEDDRRRV